MVAAILPRYLPGEDETPSEAPFRDVRNLLESHGWTLSRISGSHHAFSKPGESPIVVPVHRNKVPPQ
jgi:predicted RNA binding protein YcfA (HicA-like mRNA interferase family)